MTDTELFERIEEFKRANSKVIEALRLNDEATKVYRQAVEVIEVSRPNRRSWTSNKSVPLT
jgi:hypothetical protein